MSYTDKLQRIEELKQAIEKHGKLSEEILKKIDYKFRLEWNYTSNSMEGNSLTKQETRSVMVGNITVEGKPIKDVQEMIGHDQVITTIMKIGRGELNISESRIKEIHKGILHEEDPDKKNQIGVWKKTPNHLFNYKNEKFDFVMPEDVPERMHQLINWLNGQKEKIDRKDKEALHPVQLAFQFHLDYITIHPFYDGNGRTVRILTNLILISYGYPPVYIKENEKGPYYQYLADIQGYGGSSDLFYDFMSGLLIRSLQLVVNAAEGRDIEEPGDLDKKIFLLEKELEIIDPEEEVKVQFSNDVLSEMLTSWIDELCLKAIMVVQKFNKLFTGTNHSISIQPGGAYVQFVNDTPAEVFMKLLDNYAAVEDRFQRDATFSFNTFYGTLKKGGLNTFGCNYSFEIKFESIKYLVYVDEFVEEGNNRKSVLLYEKLLHKPLAEIEMEKIVNLLADAIYKHIDFNTKKKGLR